MLHHYLSITHIKWTNNSDPWGMYVLAMTGQAMARNTHLVYTCDPFTMCGPCTDELLYEVADHAIIAEICGYHQHGVGSTGGNIVDHHTGLEAGFQGEIGMVAGLLTESNQLGYVGSYPTDSVYTSVNAFHMGARSVNPDVTTKVVLINSWFDPAAANQAANTLIDDGADFLFGIMDEAAYLEVAHCTSLMVSRCAPGRRWRSGPPARNSCTCKRP